MSSRDSATRERSCRNRGSISSSAGHCRGAEPPPDALSDSVEWFVEPIVLAPAALTWRLTIVA